MTRYKNPRSDNALGCFGCLFIWAIYLLVAGVSVAFIIWISVTVLNLLNVI